MGFKNIYMIMYKKFNHVSVKGITIGYFNSLQVFMNVCCLLCDVHHSHCLLQVPKWSELKSVMHSNENTHSFQQEQSLTCVTSFIIFFKWTNTLQNVFFWVNHGHLVFKLIICDVPLGPFLFFCVVEGWTQAPKKTYNILTMNVVFFKWASSPIIFSSFFFFNLGHLLFIVVFCVQACHPCGVPLAPTFCVVKGGTWTPKKS